MSALLLLVFNALFANEQTAPAWESLSQLADERQLAEDYRAAELVRREALRLAEIKLGPADKQLAPLLTNLALSLHFSGHDMDADPFVRRAVLIAEQSGDRRLTGRVLNALGVVLSGEGDPARAEPVLRRSLAIIEETAGVDSLASAEAANNLGTLYADTGQYSKAEQLLARALPVYEKTLGPENRVFAMALSSMFTILSNEHRMGEGEPFLRRALAIGAKQFPKTLDMASLQHCQAAFEANNQRNQEAARLMEKVIAIRERVLGPDHPLLGRSLNDYSIILRRMHQKTEAKQAQNRANLILKSLH